MSPNVSIDLTDFIYFHETFKLYVDTDSMQFSTWHIYLDPFILL